MWLCMKEVKGRIKSDRIYLEGRGVQWGAKIDRNYFAKVEWRKRDEI